MCGERKIVTISFCVGSGIGPDTFAPVFLAVSTIFSADDLKLHGHKLLVL